MFGMMVTIPLFFGATEIIDVQGHAYHCNQDASAALSELVEINNIIGTNGTRGEGKIRRHLRRAKQQILSSSLCERSRNQSVRVNDTNFRDHEKPRRRRHRRRAIGMEPSSFVQLKELFNQEAFDGQKTNLARDLSRHGGDDLCVSSGQVTEILELFTFDGERLNALHVLAPHLEDPENGFVTGNAFTFQGNRQNARQVIRNKGGQMCRG